MANIRIVARDGNGIAQVYLRMTHATYAEMVFTGLTKDPINQEFNWILEVQGEDKQWEAINWHFPQRSVE